MTEVVEVRATPRGARAVCTVQVVLLVVYLVGSFGILLAAMARTGDYGAFWHPGVERLGDPKDSMSPLGPDSTGNPFVWIFGLSRVVAFFGRVLAPVLTLLGLAFLVPAWLARDRRAVRLVAVSTGAWLAFAVLSFTPYGSDLLGWLLD
jgi:hypothetical protein